MIHEIHNDYQHGAFDTKEIAGVSQIDDKAFTVYLKSGTHAKVKFHSDMEADEAKKALIADWKKKPWSW